MKEDEEQAGRAGRAALLLLSERQASFCLGTVLKLFKQMFRAVERSRETVLHVDGLNGYSTGPF